MDKYTERTLNSIREGFKSLLETRHLYQSVTIDLSFLRKKASPAKGNIGLGEAKASEFGDNNAKIINIFLMPENCWKLLLTDVTELKDYTIPLPRIKIFCSKNNRDEPFYPKRAVTIFHGRLDEKIIESFMIAYECQSCNSPITFMIRREGVKLVLTGRSPIEQVQIPKFIPKLFKKYISDAIVANESGQTLPGLFMLRTFIEQYTKSCSSIPDLLADQYIERYMNNLPTDFKAKFPSLSQMYADLSLALHTANASSELFDRAIDDLYKHFDAKRLFKID